MNVKEKKVVNKMIVIYCRANHESSGDKLCDECNVLNEYAMTRLEKCPFGENKPTCGSCSIHCYKKDMKDKIRQVMRFSGPRMFFRHPIDTLQHFIREFKRKELYPAANESRLNNK